MKKYRMVWTCQFPTLYLVATMLVDIIPVTIISALPGEDKAVYELLLYVVHS